MVGLLIESNHSNSIRFDCFRMGYIGLVCLSIRFDSIVFESILNRGEFDSNDSIRSTSRRIISSLGR